MLTLGYIGNGKSTNRYHLPFVLQRKPMYKVKSIYERDPGHRAWPMVDDIVYTSHMEDLLEDDEVDVIVICTSQDSHFEYAKRALLHHKHVLVEKPFMMDQQQTNEIFELAHRMNKHIECFQNRRYDSDFLTLCKVIKEGKLGELYEVEMHFDYYRPQTPTNAIYSRYEGFLYGHGCHTIDQVVSFFGIPSHIEQQVKCLCGSDAMNDYFDIDLFYGERLKVSVKSSYFRIRSRPSMIAYGKKGMFVKATRDRQEADLKEFYLPDHADFGVDSFEDYGVLTYEQDGHLCEEKVMSCIGDYGRVYDALYKTIVQHVPSAVKESETRFVMSVLEQGSLLCERTHDTRKEDIK